MELKQIVKSIIAPERNIIDKKWYFAPLIPAILWIILSFISLFTIDSLVLLDPFVIVSVLARFAFPIYSLMFIKRFYIKGQLKPINYNHELNFIGYSISLSYVSYMLPGVVLDFYNSGSTSGIFTLFVVLSTLCPIAMYTLLKCSKVKLASGYFTTTEVLDEKKRKRDKKLKKQHQRVLRRERTMLQNLWFEVLDPLMWAILWVLMINSTLFQLYEIPSSSMVPEFLEKDRVVASKLFSGPKLPLTKYQLPEIGKPKVGDIVTFNNPKVDDPNSDLHYKNVFTRIFQPFFFMLSFSKLDIDAGANGYPKARQLVKRVIGVPGDKICMVNDKIYKKTKDMDWTLMSEIDGQREFGHGDLFSIDSKNSGAQFINPSIREELDRAAKMALDVDLESVNNQLKLEKYKFIGYLNSLNTTGVIDTLASYNRKSLGSVNEVIGDLNSSYRGMMQVNRSASSVSSKNRLVEEFKNNLDEYSTFILFDKINDLMELITIDRKLFEDEFEIDLEIPEGASPYDEFVVKLDALSKLKSLELYNLILSSGEFDSDIDIVDDLKSLSLYISGLQINAMDPFSYFGAGNLPEYPAKKGEYIPKGEYFLLGDNRYNSLDSRMGDGSYDLLLNPEGGELSERINVSWEPHTISDSYIHGEVKFILFPFSHFKLFL